MAPPSAMTNPSRPRSKGRDAAVGSVVERPRQRAQIAETGQRHRRHRHVCRRRPGTRPLTRSPALATAAPASGRSCRWRTPPTPSGTGRTVPAPRAVRRSIEVLRNGGAASQTLRPAGVERRSPHISSHSGAGRRAPGRRGGFLAGSADPTSPSRAGRRRSTSATALFQIAVQPRERPRRHWPGGQGTAVTWPAIWLGWSAVHGERRHAAPRPTCPDSRLSANSA